MSESDTNKIVRIFTIGYAGKNARNFFTILKHTGIKKVIDVRLYNTSQLAGYTKKRDLEYFLQAIAGTDYIHLPVMAPTKQLLNDYKKGDVNWEEYEIQFNSIITERHIEKYLELQDLDMSCFLCAEATADKCHRRLVVEYMSRIWPDITIQHL